MDVNRLLSDELVYELRVRELPVYSTVAENRATLRGALRCEKQGLIGLTKSSAFSPQSEYAICTDKLTELKRHIVQFDHTNKVNEYKRISTRLGHILARLKRVSEGNESLENVRSELIGKCLQLMDALETANTSELQGSSNQVETSLIDIDGENKPECSILDDNSPLIPEVLQESNSVPPSNDVVHAQTSSRQVHRSSVLEMTDEVEREIEQMRAQLRSENETMGRLLGRGSQTQLDSAGTTHQAQSNPPLASNLSQRQATALSNQVPVSRQVDPSTSTGVYPQQYCTYPSEPATYVPQAERQHAVSFAPTPRHETSSGYSDATSNVVANRLSHMSLAEAHPDYSQQVYRWKLQFDGQSSVTSFLERISEMQSSRGVSDSQLLRAGPEIFTKDALLWYRTRKFESWSQLVDQLRADFLPYDYEYDLWEEIRRRTQGATEKVLIYVSVMENLFNRLGSSKPDEEARVRIIQRNLLPHIQSQLSLQQPRTISELLRLCRMVEETAIRAQRFCPPTTNHRQLLEPDLAYQRPTHSRNTAISEISLLDSGASKTVLGGSGWKQLASSLQLDESVSKHCTVANGEKCEVLGKVSLPIRLQNRVKLISPPCRSFWIKPLSSPVLFVTHVT
nr:unnamed protein product [Callosobruchus analis]